MSDGTYFDEEMFEGMDYRAVREEALEHTKRLGESIFEDSATATAFAADTGAEGLSVKDFLVRFGSLNWESYL